MLSHGDRAATLEVLDTGLRQAKAVVKVQNLAEEVTAPEVEGRYRQFCTAMAAVQNDHLAVPYTFGTFSRQPGGTFGYTTRPFVTGTPLSGLVLPVAEGAALIVGLQICEGLDALHARGLFHCDLKPENVIVRHAPAGRIDEHSQCVVIDLSYRPESSAGTLTEMTLQYVAPEMLEGQPADRQTDLYAVGVMLYRLLSGRYPFEGASLPEIMRKKRVRDFTPLAVHRPDVSPGLCKALARLLEPNPANRPENAQALAALLGEFGSAGRRAPDAIWRPGFVGREAELAACIAALDLDRASTGASSIEVCGTPGVGVSALLRELQDRLEARGMTVLTATPRAVGGATLQSQLGEAVRALIRRPSAPSVGTEHLRPPETSSDLLDDLFVAAQDRRLALFVDDWRVADVAEIQFVRRLILQDNASSEGMTGRSGRCQVVLGDTSGDGEGDAAEALARVVAKRIRLEGLTEEDVAQLLAMEGTLPRLYAARLRSTTGGSPRSIRAILERVRSSCATGTGDALDAAEDAVAGPEADAKAREIGAIHRAPNGPALLALALWGEELALGAWRTIVATLGGAGLDNFQADRIERSGKEFVRSRHRHLSESVARCLDDTERTRIADAVIAATRDGWWSREPEDLVKLLRFVVRIGELPPRSRWGVCRALILLLDRGRLSEVESIAATLGRHGGMPWWLGLFHEAAQAGSSGASTQPEGAAVEVRDAVGFFRGWIRARSLLRARYRQEALRILEALSASHVACAQAVSLALAEDHALAAAEVGALDKVTSLRRRILHRVRSWLPLTRRGRDKDVGTMRARLRACRQVARYQRVRSRAHLLRGKLNRALAACRRERRLDRADGNLLREASCLNNEGILMIRAHAEAAAVPALERCVKLRERLDDEHGLVIALTNLAAAQSASGNLGAAASALNRARIVATRNGLGRLRNSALANLAVAYSQRGQLRDAQRVLRQVDRLAGDDGDAEAMAGALFNRARVASDRWSPLRAERCALHLDRMRELRADCPCHLRGDLIRAEVAYRSRDWAHLHTLVARMTGAEPRDPATAVYEGRVAVESGNEAPQKAVALERASPPGARLRFALMRRRDKRLPPASLSRVVAFARRHASAREAVEWILAHLERPEGDTDEALAAALGALSWFEFREGHDDLQIELRARVAGMLRRRERHAEAWHLIEDALLRFRRLERRLRRWARGAHVLLHLQERLLLALTGSLARQPGNGQEMSAALCVRAFDVLMENRRRNVGARDPYAPQMLRLGAALGRGGDRDAFIDEVLSVAIAVTGVERAIVITGTPRAPAVLRTLGVDGGWPEARLTEMSWAVVSQVLASGEPGIFSDALTSEELASHRSIAVLNLRSLACVPLRAGGQVLGALYLDHHGIAGLIGQEMLGFLELLANLIGITLHASSVEGQAAAAQRELVEAYRHMMRAERNRVASEIAAGLVHDMKNVLAAVSGRAQLLRRANQDPQVLRSLDAIERAAATGVGLVQRLQECARDHSSQREEVVDLAVTAQEALELLAPRLEKNGVRVDVHASAPASAWGAAGEYREMFLNLFVNACDAMPNGGTLSVSFAVSQEPGHLEIKVSDTGVGMSAETKARVFEPFFTTKGSHGTGLGLVVVRNVLVRYGGSVAVESSPGAGACFHLIVPAARGSSR